MGWKGTRMGAAAVAAAAGFALAASGSGGGSFESAGDMAGGGRSSHVAVRLHDGRVLVAGGSDETSSSALASAETWDPGTGVFTATGSLGQARIFASAHLLPDGRVLVAGGISSGTAHASTEIWDPDTAAFSAGPPMSVARGGQRTVALGNGRTLAVGGFDAFGAALAAAEIHDPTPGPDGSWSATGSLAHPRQSHAAVRLADGRVLVAGGSAGSEGGYATLAACEIYDPSAGTFSAAASLPAPRSGAAGALLPDGRVLLAGGAGAGGAASFHDALAYDPVADTWSPVGSTGSGGPGVSLTALANGCFLLAGGAEMPGQETLDEADLFDPSTGTFQALEPMVHSRTNHPAIPLEDGRVLLPGGNFLFAPGVGHGRASADLYVPDDYVPPSTGITAVGPARAWVGRRSGRGDGADLDLLAEVLLNGAVVAAGRVDGASGGRAGFDGAVQHAIDLVLAEPVPVASGDVLGFRLSVRMAAGGRGSARARLWYDDASADSRFEATIDGVVNSLYLRDGGVLGSSAGSGSMKAIDVKVNRKKDGDAFREFGTWTVTLP